MLPTSWQQVGSLPGPRSTGKLRDLWGNVFNGFWALRKT